MNHRRILDKVILPRALALAVLPLALAACAGPPITTPIDGEPTCKDFEIGAARSPMAGSLRFPVQVTIKHGSTVVFKTTLVGRRNEKDLPSRVLLSDDNETFAVEWAQCENERAPSPLDVTGRDHKGSTKYECGKAEVYQTVELKTVKGDAKSHALSFQAPPNSACWTAPPPPPEAADAGAPDAAPEAADAGAPAEDAGADAGPAAADADAGATDAGSSDAGATDAGAKADSGATKSK